MLTNEFPGAWHSDDYIKAWAAARGGDRMPIYEVELRTMSREELSIARIYFGSYGQPVVRMNPATGQQIMPDGGFLAYSCKSV
jgi:hypothetical protein